MSKNKRDSSTLEEYKDITNGYNSNPLLWLAAWHPWIKKRVNYLSSIEGKGDLKDTQRNTQNAALIVDLLWNIYKAEAIQPWWEL